MRRQIIITNIFVIFFSLVLLLFLSIFVLRDLNRENTANELNDRLNLITQYFDGSNYQETEEFFIDNDTSLRLTIIDLDGKVIVDSESEGELESHTNRPEIVQPGSIQTRFSDTLGISMMYLSAIDDGHYIRVALPLSFIDQLILNYLAYGIIALIFVFTISTLILLPLVRKSFKPLNSALSKFSVLAGDRNYESSDSIEDLTNKVEYLEQLVNKKIADIKDESFKLEQVFNSMNQGLIVVDNHYKILATNNFAAEIFKVKLFEVTNKDLLFLVRDYKIQETIKKVKETKSYRSIDEKINNRTYQINFIPFNNFDNQNVKQGLIIVINDVTELRNIENIKREFFANASHELKSPLTTILGYQQMIKERIITSKEDVDDATIRTIKEVNRMSLMVSEMLQLSKLESNIQEAEIEVRADVLLKEIIERYKSLITLSSIKINLDLEPATLKVNPSHLDQLFSNLIENSIKYNKDNGSIDIKLTTNKFVIRDSGIGIAQEHVNRVFERFYRVDKAKSKETGGTGLGLAIVKHVCSKYNFKIKLESQIKIGTTITVNF